MTVTSGIVTTCIVARAATAWREANISDPIAAAPPARRAKVRTAERVCSDMICS